MEKFPAIIVDNLKREPNVTIGSLSNMDIIKLFPN
jgi:hypothetical protein